MLQVSNLARPFGDALTTYEGTVLVVVHDRYFIRRFATGIWAIEEGRIRRYVDSEDVRRSRDVHL